MVRREYIFEGAVQGVGFRWRACRAAEACGITGNVENLYDGSVRLTVQGKPEQIEKQLLFLESSPYIRIENFSVKNLPLVEGESGFYSK